MSTPEARIAVWSFFGAVLGVAGVLVGAWIAASSAEKVAVAQIQSQRLLARSEAAMKMIDYTGTPIADIYAANIKLQQFDIATMNEAARQLAIAAAIGAARAGGEVGLRCMELSRSADLFGKIPLSEVSMKSEAAGKMGRDVAELMVAYNTYRKSLQDDVLPPPTQLAP